MYENQTQNVKKKAIKWFYVDSDKVQQGPIKEVEFIKLFQNDTITPETLVWNGKTAKDWCKLSTIEGVEDAMRNWKPGSGQLLTSVEKLEKKKTKINQEQQLDGYEVKNKVQVQEKAKEQQSQACLVAQTTDQGLDSDETQKQVRPEWKVLTEDEKKKEWHALEAIIRNESDALDEKYSESMENLAAKVTDLELRLSRKVGEVEEWKKKLQIKKADTTKTPVNEEKNPEESTETSEYSAANFEKLNREKTSLQEKSLALTEEHRLFQEKMKSHVIDLESKLSTKVTEVNELKEKLQTSSEWAKLEEERKVFNNQVKTLNVEKSKFEKFKNEELARMKSSGKTAADGVKVSKESSYGLLGALWTWVAIGLVSVVGYKMISRAITPESNAPASVFSGGESGKRTFTDSMSSKLPSKVTSFFNM